MRQTIVETERLKLYRIVKDDFSELAKMLCDARVMYAWEHAFSDQEVDNWIAQQMRLYEQVGYGYMIAKDKLTGETVGQIGVLPEKVGGEETVFGVGYILCFDHWGKGYAVEGAKGCLEYAFTALGAKSVVCTIRPENQTSVAVAKKLGMTQNGQFIKHYNGKDMPHLIYAIDRVQAGY